MRVGIIGAGLQASRRAPTIRQSGDELAVVAAAHDESARRLADANGCEHAASWEDVVDRDDIDAVLVCTPPSTHYPISMAAMRNGKHVLCEKPFALDSKEAKEMVAFSAKNATILKCGFNHRYHPSLREIRRLIADGELGRIYYLTASYGIEARAGYENEWKASPKFVSGGQLMDHGIHLIDLSRWFLGDFSEVFAVARNYHVRNMPFEDNAFVTLKTLDEKVAFVHASLTQWINRFMFEVVGSDGYAQSIGLGGSYGTETLTLGKREPGRPFSYTVAEFRGEDHCWLDEWQHFRSLRGTDESLESAIDGLKAVQIVERAYEAARTNAVVSL
ncbi:MAG: Gfo/Idh/MocA family oxidoreductase [Nitrososphaerota archaeon]|nr:Gfo/Idh/MocA family oxidoreductase [Nitrososphaerota archaeon]